MNPEDPGLVEVLCSNDVVLLSFAEAVLRAADIPCIVMDAHMSIMEGSIGVLPRRLMVAADKSGRARSVLFEAGLGPHLSRKATGDG